MNVIVSRKEVKFNPDPSRVIARFYYTNDERSKAIIKQVLSMPEDEAKVALNQVLRGYSKRHRNISRVFETHFNKLHHLLNELNIAPDKTKEEVKVLIGSYFTMEYSIESAAFFNPSVVEDPDQSELQIGEKRVIFSFRATGEGHISSIVFRSGILDKDNNLQIEPVGKMLDEAENIKRHIYNKEQFKAQLYELQSNKKVTSNIFSRLGDDFTYGELSRSVKRTKEELQLSSSKERQVNQILWLASSHYEIKFSLDTAISERVIFPVSENERNGIEDARFVKFTDDDGAVTYFATYTAYDGMAILPKLIETKDFYYFKILPINGEIGRNKGMALFPRKINGKYAMLCRIDGVNNYIAFSDKINVWNDAKLIQEPRYPWEFIQIGNCGSPIETEAGWLVLTHAVGQMREYVLGASLFDLDNPAKETGRLKTPLLMPNEEEREGYVPNVVYTCGSIIHNNNVIIPYAMSDYKSTYATVDLTELLNELKNSK
uniref:glycoside hydrolase family 130 protein n=1 Tax=uncultured Draconibacterium sp. TaxID=1573823 RepID=UPI0032162A82